MIYQGGNAPIVVTLPTSESAYTSVSVSAYDSDGKQVKTWATSDLTINENKVSASITQQESASFPEGKIKVLVKWKDPDTDEIKFGNDLYITVIKREDKTVIL